MLVLSRRVDEKVYFPGLGITLKVVRVKGNTVRLGIDAPSEIRVVRDELHDSETNADLSDSVSYKKDSSHKQDDNAPAAGYDEEFERFLDGDTLVQRALQSRLNAANLAIHMAQNQLKRGLNEHAWDALDDAVRCLEALEGALVDSASKQISEYDSIVREKSEGYDTAGKSATTDCEDEKLTAVIIDAGDNGSVDPVTTFRFGQYLENAGYHVVTASPEQAVGFLANLDQPDFVVMPAGNEDSLDGSANADAVLDEAGESSSDNASHLCVAGISGLRPGDVHVNFREQTFTGWFSSEASVVRLQKTLETAG